MITFFMELVKYNTAILEMLKKLWIHLILTISLHFETKSLKSKGFDQEYVLQQIDFFLLWANVDPLKFPVITANLLNGLLRRVVSSPQKSKQSFGFSSYLFSISSESHIKESRIEARFDVWA